MDPTRKKQPKSSTIKLSPPLPNPIPSSTLKKITSQYAKWNANHKARAVAAPKAAVDPPRIDTHLQAKAMARSANADPSIKPKTQQLQRPKHINPSPEMETQKKKAKEKEKIISSSERDEPKRPSVSLVVGGARRKSFCDSQIELGELFSRLNVKVVAVDMPPFMQIHAVSCARKVYDSLDKFTSKTLACTLKKEFDGVYGPAWHCIVGSSFGSFVTHSVGGFVYFSMDQKLYILLFKTTVQRAAE